MRGYDVGAVQELRNDEIIKEFSLVETPVEIR